MINHLSPSIQWHVLDIHHTVRTSHIFCGDDEDNIILLSNQDLYCIPLIN